PRHAGHRRDRPGRRLRPGLPADSRGAHLRDHGPPGEDRPGREVPGQPVGEVRGGTAGMTVVAETALSPAAEKLRERLGRSPVGERARVADSDLPTIEVGPEDWPALARFLRDDPECRYDLFLDLLGVDNLRRSGSRSRFETVAHLHSL